MHKIFFSIIALLLILFHSCEKAETIQSTEIEGYVSYDISDYQEHIDALIESTGINIYKLSEIESIRQFAQKQVCRCLVNQVHLRGDVTEQKLYAIQSLEEQIYDAYNYGDSITVLILYDSLCAICSTIDGFIFNTNEYGFQEVVYDPEQAPVHLPIIQMKDDKEEAIALREQIESDYPEINTLPEETKIEVIASALYIQSSRFGIKYYSVADCEKAAKNKLVWNLSLATAAYIATAATCAGTMLAIVVCESLAYATYISAAAGMRHTYNLEIERCRNYH